MWRLDNQFINAVSQAKPQSVVTHVHLTCAIRKKCTGFALDGLLRFDGRNTYAILIVTFDILVIFSKIFMIKNMLFKKNYSPYYLIYFLYRYVAKSSYLKIENVWEINN